MEAIFFPRNDYPNNAEVCIHRYGKKMTMCECTTMMPKLVAENMLPYVVQLNRTNNIRVNGFFDDRNVIEDYVLEQIDNGVVVPDVYFLSYPTYDYSQEAIVNSKTRLWTWFKNTFGRTPTAIVYGLTASNYGDYLKPYIFAGQNNNADDDTDYGIGVGNPDDKPYSLNRYYRKNVNRRALDSAILHDEDWVTYRNFAANLIDNTLALENGGLIVSFNHWHDLYSKTQNPTDAIENGFKPYFDMLAQKNVNDEIYFSGYSEAIEYLIYRESVNKVVMYSPIQENTSLIIQLETKNVHNVDVDLLQTPISVKFSTVGTPLEDEQIESEQNLISLGNNNYIIEISYNEYPRGVVTKKYL